MKKYVSIRLIMATMAVSILLVTSTACATRWEVDVLTRDGGWVAASVNARTARKIERRQKPGKDSAIVHIKGEGTSVYLFVRYPLPVAGSHLPRFRRSAKEFQIPEDLVRIEFQQPSEPREI